MRESSNDITRAIVKALLYSDIWNYPLTAQEIFERMDVSCADTTLVQLEISHMIRRKQIFAVGNYYSLHNDILLAIRRDNGNRMAKNIMPTAIRKSRLAYSFPFVRSVMVSGSLSKNYFDEKADIDFFVVTEPGKVWFTRALMTLYKRMFLKNSHKFFCVNYYIDTEHLSIEERNIFTATELATVLPVCGREWYDSLVDHNRWISEYYPQFRSLAGCDLKPFPWVPKKITEVMLRPFTMWLDRLAMHRFIKRTSKVYGKGFTEDDFKLAFKSTPYVSKNHLDHYQKKVTNEFQQKVDRYFREMVEL